MQDGHATKGGVPPPSALRKLNEESLRELHVENVVNRDRVQSEFMLKYLQLLYYYHAS